MPHLDAAELRREFENLYARLDRIERKIDALAGTPMPEPEVPPVVEKIDVPEGVLHLLRAGQKEQAVEAYHQLAGVEMPDAEATITKLEAQLKNGSRP